MRAMTKSPIEVAREALAIGRAGLPTYSSEFSRRDFEQGQLFAILVLRQFFRTDLRGIVAILKDLPELQRVLSLTKVPHHTTLFYAEKRFFQTKERSAVSSSPSLAARFVVG